MIEEILTVAAPAGAAYGLTGSALVWRRGWSRVQGSLWPLTAGYAVYRRVRPLPQLLREDAVRRLEAEVGVGPYSVPMIRAAYQEMLRLVQSGKYAHCHQPFKDAKAEYLRLMWDYFPAETPVQTLVWNVPGGSASLSIRSEAPERPSASLYPWESYETFGEARERYDELRESLAASLERGDDLMKTNATERLVEWCRRNNDPRRDWYFPQPGQAGFVPWTREKTDWTEVFGPFQ